MSVPFVLDRRSPVPLHRQLYDAWRAGILHGRFRPGERVPSTRALAATYGVARITITAAYDQLLAEGYFETRRGSGTFVSSELPDRLFNPVRAGLVAGNTAPTVGLSRYGSRLGQIQRLPRSTGSIDLSNASPDLAHFPFSLWRRLVTRHLRKPSAAAFERSGRPAGDPRLQEALAGYLARSRAVRCSPEQIIIVSGSQQALDLCARLLLDPGDEVAVEQPGYTAARQLFLAHGARLRAIGVTDEGASVDGLTENTRLVHVTPSHQFPTGVSMSLPRRLALAEWARTRTVVVLEDDYDSEYRYASRPVASLQGLDTKGCVMYCGSFSKVLFPSLRLGYLVVPPQLAESFTCAKGVLDRHSPTIEQAVMAEFIAEGHLARHIRRMRMLYLERQTILLESLRSELAGVLDVRSHEAGMHVVGWLQKGKNDAVVSRRARQLGIEAPALMTYREKSGGRGGLVLGYAAYTEQQIRQAVKQLAAALQ